MLDMMQMNNIQLAIYKEWQMLIKSVLPEVGQIDEELSGQGKDVSMKLQLVPFVDCRCPLRIDMLSGPYDLVDIHYARYAQCELSPYMGYTPEYYHPISRAIIRAVMFGNIKETIYRDRRSNVVQDKTVLLNEPGHSGDSWTSFTIWGLIFGTIKEEIQYIPYV